MMALGNKDENIFDFLKEIYVSLSMAIESGDQLKIGIVLGQVLVKIENQINDKTNRDAKRNDEPSLQEHKECEGVL